MAKATKGTNKMDDIEKQIDEAVGAQGSLMPGSAMVSDPKSKVEAMARVVQTACAMSATDLNKYWSQVLNQYAKLRGEGPSDAEKNKATQNMKGGGDEEGSGGPIAAMPLEKGMMAQNVQNMTKEDMDAVFSGTDLTEEAQGQLTAIFEAAVSLRVNMAEQELIEKYEEDLENAVALFIEETKAGLDDYVEYAVDQWISENEVAVVDTLRTENAEEFMEKLRDLFVESYFDVPEDRLDVVREMSETVVDLESKLDEAIQIISTLQREVDEKAYVDAVSAVTEGMTLSDKEKFKTLAEDVSYDGDTALLSKKLVAIKENLFGEKKAKRASGSTDVLNENTDGFVEKTPVYQDPLVAAAARLLGASR